MYKFGHPASSQLRALTVKFKISFYPDFSTHNLHIIVSVIFRHMKIENFSSFHDSCNFFFAATAAPVLCYPLTFLSMANLITRSIESSESSMRLEVL